jgi:hypothetical protein
MQRRRSCRFGTLLEEFIDSEAVPRAWAAWNPVRIRVPVDSSASACSRVEFEMQVRRARESLHCVTLMQEQGVKAEELGVTSTKTENIRYRR